MSKSSLRTGVHEVEGREGVPIRAKRERARNLHPGSATVTMLITGAVAWSQYKGQFPVEWSPNAGGWIMHCISTASEWLMALRCEFDRSQFYLLSDGDE